MVAKIGNITIKSKLILTACVFLLPAIVMIYFIISGIDYDVRFSTLEVYGNQYQREVMKIFKLFSDYYYLKNMSNDMSQVHNTAARIDDAFDSLKKIDDKIGEYLQFTEHGLALRKREFIAYDNFKQAWLSIKNNTNTDEQAYDDLVKIIRETIVHSGDTSNLILDPDLDSYYLMDITLLAVPQTLGRFYSLIDGVLHDRYAPEDLYVLKSHFYESDYSRIMSSGGTSLNEDANFYGVLPSLQSDFKSALDRYDQETTGFLSGFGEYIQGTRSKSEFLKDSKQAMDVCFEFWNESVDELDLLLDKRIIHYKQQRLVSLAFSLIAFLFSGLVTVLVGLSILYPIKEILMVINKTKEGNLVDKIMINTKDEIGEIAGNVNTLIGSLNRIISGLKQIAMKSNTMGQTLTVNSEEISATLDQISGNVESVILQVEELNKHIMKSDKAKNEIVEMLARQMAVIGDQKDSLANTSSVMNDMVNAISHISEISVNKQETVSSIIELADIGEKDLRNNAELINKISEQIRSISEFISIIDAISTSTNILAMNASIEAAHAGESGRGFSVVAKEIRKLSLSTAEYAKKMSSMIKNIQGEIGKTISMTNKTTLDVTSVLQGIRDISHTLNETIEGLRTLSGSTDMITQLFALLSDVSQKVDVASLSTGDKVREIEGAMQDIVHLSDDTYASIKEISIGVGEIAKSVAYFTEMSSENAENVHTLNEEILLFKTQ